MRLWHYLLIPFLPDAKTTRNRKLNQLGGQHVECCIMRGNGWGMKHSIVDYVFKHNFLQLTHYHQLVIFELMKREYNIDEKWLLDSYRGKIIGSVDFLELPNINYAMEGFEYYEHNDKYLQECLDNLKEKGIYIDLDSGKTSFHDSFCLEPIYYQGRK